MVKIACDAASSSASSMGMIGVCRGFLAFSPRRWRKTIPLARYGLRGHEDQGRGTSHVDRRDRLFPVWDNAETSPLADNAASWICFASSLQEPPHSMKELPGAVAYDALNVYNSFYQIQLYIFYSCHVPFFYGILHPLWKALMPNGCFERTRRGNKK